MNRFEKWDEQFEKKHPIVYAILTGVTGIGAILTILLWALVVGAVI